MVEIQEGKFYRTREGHKVGPMVRGGMPMWPWEDSSNTVHDAWRTDGTTWLERRAELPTDIIAEWVDPIELVEGGNYRLKDGRETGPLVWNDDERWKGTWSVWTAGFLRENVTERIVAPAVTVVAGGVYLTADGERVGPMVSDGSGHFHSQSGRLWDARGERYTRRFAANDIVAVAPAEPARADDDGWIAWRGGELGVKPPTQATEVTVKFRDGTTRTDSPSNLDWWHAPPDSEWPLDIVAYRSSEPAAPELAYQVGERLRWNGEQSSFYTPGKVYEVQSRNGHRYVLTDDKCGGHEWTSADAIAKRFAREAAEPAKPVADGWIEWRGGECPVPAGVQLDVRLRFGNAFSAIRRAPALRWTHEGNPGDIVAYRLIRGEPSPQPSNSDPAFKIGDRVQHRRMGDLGTIVELPSEENRHVYRVDFDRGGRGYAQDESTLRPASAEPAASAFVHDLKSWVGLFEPIASGAKTHDLRVMDRPYKVGDVCLLREWEPTEARYTGRECRVAVTYITSGSGQEGHSPCAFSPVALHPGMAVLSIKLLEAA